MLEVLNELESLKACFMTGGNIDKSCPDAWKDLDELSVLAMTGQFIRTVTRPTATADIVLRPEIPNIDLPPMPEALRAHFRRILEGKTAKAVDVVRLIASRGYCVNPTDWMPQRYEPALPAVYDAWQDWVDGNDENGGNDVLSAQSWDAFPAHTRHRTLTVLHGTDPDAARALIEEVAPTLAAEQRLRMLECLRSKLTQGDRPLLETFDGDRSSKVKSFVRVQLARLGADIETSAEATEQVGDFFELARAGVLKRRKVISVKKLKNNAQRNRRRSVIGKTSLRSFAQALGISRDDVIEIVEIGDALQELADMIASSGTDAHVDRLAARIVQAGQSVPDSLIDRVSPECRVALGKQVLAKDAWRLFETQRWFSAQEGTLSLDDIKNAQALTELCKLAVENENNNQDQYIAHALNVLGLIADRDTAKALVERLTSAGMTSVDPRLTLLRLNAAL